MPSAARSNEFADVESCFPVGYRLAEDISKLGQATYKRTIIASLALLFGASVFGAISRELAGWASAGLFATSIVLLSLAITKHAEFTWYDGRALAESLKTTAWKFCVCGEPFVSRDENAEARWHETVRSISSELSSLQSGIDVTFDDSPDSLLRELRNQSLELRMAIYRKQRIAAQRDWYHHRGTQHVRTSVHFEVASVALQAGGVLLGVAKGLGLVDVDLLSIAATGASGLIAWRGVGDHRTISRSYQFAAIELDRSLAEMPAIETEEAWATFVADTEAAMSREHTMWVTRRRGPTN